MEEKMAAASSFLLLLLFFSWLDLGFSLTQSDALLQLKKSIQNAGPLSSWAPGSDPCSAGWAGVVCFHGIVTGLRLSRLGLAGTIDVDALQQIVGLRYVSFDGNDFSGPLPKFSRAGMLKSIFLQGNSFSGAVPDDAFMDMASLKKLWLAENNFTGPIPSSLTLLPHLMEIHLENNAFSGNIPTFQQPSLKSFNVSNNLLVGNVPSELAAMFDASCFSGNPNLCFNDSTCTGSRAESQGKISPRRESSHSGNPTALMVAVAMVVICAAFYAMKIRQQKSKAQTVYGSSKDNTNIMGKEMISPPLEIQVEEKAKKVEKVTPSPRPSPSPPSSPPPSAWATAQPPPSPQAGTAGAPELVFVQDNRSGFALMDLMKASAEVLGSGALGSSYKAVLMNGTSMVVKRMRDMNQVGKEELHDEMLQLGRIKHPNILPPTAYHYRKEEKLLVYEYATNGNLLFLIHGDRGPHRPALEWPTRLKIIQGIARGMAHLHIELGDMDLPHGNLKSTNVLFGDGCEPLIVDYAFSPLINPTLASQNMVAFRSPEFLQGHQVCHKSDVWSLGIVILEIITGKFPSQYLNHSQGGIDLPLWIRSAILEGRMDDIFDPEIAQDPNSVPSQMSQLLQIGLVCTERSLEKRPEMAMVQKMIEEIKVDEESVLSAPSLTDCYGDLARLSRANMAALFSSRQSRKEGYGSRRHDDSFNCAVP